MTSCVRIAMWSGPRNLSTAMMRSFGARTDCAVWDEPFYAPYLHMTGLDHPMRAQILAAHERDPALIAARCGGPAPHGRALFYQKHMTHHMLEGFDLSFLRRVRSAFLIRDPVAVAASYEKKREEPTLADLGFVEQAALFDRVAQDLGRAPPVIDAADILATPEPSLRRLCDALGIAFQREMMTWPKGPHPDDGVWGAHWYGAVNASTGFAPQDPGDGPTLATDHARRLADDARPYYERLARSAL